MGTNKILLERVAYLLDLGDRCISTRYTTEDSFFIHHWVKSGSYQEFQSAALSFIFNLYGENHPYHIGFKDAVAKRTPDSIESGKGILNSIKVEIERGWLNTFKGLISAEIFTDFLEIAEHLLQEGYKDPAGVMIGSVLEEHLRQLSIKNKITIQELKDGKPSPKKADWLNAQLANANVYNKLDQKSVTAWLDLRNKSAHGKYSEYTKQQVGFMLRGVIEFITRNSV